MAVINSMPQQTETQKKAAFEAAGLNEVEQGDVIAGRQSAPRYSRISETAEVPETPSYNSLYENNRQAEIQRQQGLLDSTEKIFNEKRDREVRAERDIGARDVARSNTISAIAGMSGGPEATTRQGGAERRTEERVSSVEQRVAAERASAISAIFGRIDQNASKAAEIELGTKREDQKRLREETSKNALNNILSFAAQDNVGWDKFSKNFKEDKDLQGEVNRTGKSLPELYELYTSTQKAPPKKTYTWKGDNLVVVQEGADGKVSTETFDAKELGIPKGTDFQTMTLGQSVYWIDKNDPFNQDGSPKLIRMGAKEAKDTKQEPVAIPTYDEFYKEFLQTPQGQNLAKQNGGDNVALGQALRKIYESAKQETLASGGGTDYDKARNLVEGAKTKDWNALRSQLMEKTKLSATDIDALLLAQGVKKPKAASADSSTMSDEEFMTWLNGGK